MAYINPYIQPFFNGYQAQMTQPMQSSIAGRQVNNFAEIVANDVPLNGQIAVFPKSDLSEVQIKRWGSDGMIITNTYRVCDAPVEPQQLTEPQPDLLEVINGRFDELKSLIDEINKPKKKVKENEQ